MATGCSDSYHSLIGIIVRIPQRAQNDCAVCNVAMVMGPPYTYDRVCADSARYPKITPDGKFPAWWETYLRDEGFERPHKGLRTGEIHRALSMCRACKCEDNKSWP